MSAVRKWLFGLDRRVARPAYYIIRFGFGGVKGVLQWVCISSASRGEETNMFPVCILSNLAIVNGEFILEAEVFPGATPYSLCQQSVTPVL